jgi:O-antigen/teichoic acid export membrane protein
MSARKSLVFSFLDRYASLAVTIVSSMIIARLLTPAEIGVFSITAVLLAFVSTIGGMGVGQYLVQEKDLTIARIRAVWAVQLGLGLAMACVVLLASYPVSVFYSEPRMLNIMLVVSLNYAINPFGSLTYAWLVREMRFDSIAVMRFGSVLGGALVSTWLAWQNFGPISLAYGSLTSTVVNALIATYFRPKFFPWRPGLAEVRRVFTFGSTLTASAFIRDFASNAPELLVGKLQGMTATGMFSRANGLVQMFSRLFVEAVSAVCLPWFSKQSRENGGFIKPFLKASAYITALGWSFCLAVICLAHPVVRVLYGPQWDQSVDLTRLLAAAMLFNVSIALCGTALLSAGAASVIARVSIVSTVPIISLVALGASIGLHAMGVAMIFAAAFTAAIWLRATARQIGMPLRDFYRALLPSVWVALLAAVGPALSLWVYGPYPDHFVLPLALGGTLGLIGFVGGVVLFQHPLLEELLMVWTKLNRRNT